MYFHGKINFLLCHLLEIQCFIVLVSYCSNSSVLLRITTLIRQFVSGPIYYTVSHPQRSPWGPSVRSFWLCWTGQIGTSKSCRISAKDICNVSCNWSIVLSCVIARCKHAFISYDACRSIRDQTSVWCNDVISIHQ